MKDIKAKFKQIMDAGHQGDTVVIYGEEHDVSELAKEHGIDLPHAKKSKKQVNTIEAESIKVTEEEAEVITGEEPE